jgi:hypothetical protein
MTDNIITPAKRLPTCRLTLEETETPITWHWYLKFAFINFVGWLVLFALFFLIANWMQDAASPVLKQ